MIVEQELLAAHAAVRRDDWVSAWNITNHILNDNPESPEALYLMGTSQRHMGNPGLALACLSKALARERNQPNLWMNYAATLHDLNRWNEAIDAFKVVSQMCPGDAMPVANIAASYTQMGRNHDAINWANQALAASPDNHIAKIAKTFSSLALGRWKDAWESAEYLYGYHLNTRIYQGEPDWDGSQGKTVVVQCDQGLGDQIMFAQCIPELQRDCKEVIIECAPRMVSLFKRNFHECHVYGSGKELEADWLDNHQIDAHVHISFLGKWYRRLDSEFPRKPYLFADAGVRAKWMQWLEKYPKPWYGIAWKGGLQATQKHLRSVDLTDFAPIMDRDGTFFDLSYQDNDLEVSRWNLENSKQVVKPPINTNHYDNTVAFVACMDEVVTVATTIIHVCGALGRTAKVLVPSIAQWREAHRVDDGGMIWYPKNSLKLYRQVEGEPWTHAIKRLACEL